MTETRDERESKVIDEIVDRIFLMRMVHRFLCGANRGMSDFNLLINLKYEYRG